MFIVDEENGKETRKIKEGCWRWIDGRNREQQRRHGYRKCFRNGWKRQRENVSFFIFGKDSADFFSELTPASRPRKKKGKMNAAPSESTRMLILFRNAEQMNKIFPEWTLKNFIEGNYIPLVCFVSTLWEVGCKLSLFRTDMNQPIELPLRNNPMVAFKLDPPLTEMGIRIAQLVGKSLIESGIKVTAIYSSPSLRCIQTAQHLMKAQPHELQIQIEPAFYDFAGHKGKVKKLYLSF